MPGDPKASLLNDTEHWYHWGCHLTSRALKKLIRSRYELVSCIPISRLLAIPQAPRKIDDFNDPGFLQSFVHTNFEIIDQLKQVDTVFINGEGSMHTGADLPMNLLYLALFCKLALDKEVHIVNQSVYPNDVTDIVGNDLERLYTDVYQLVDYAAIREPVSLKLAKQMGIEAAQPSFDCSVLELKTCSEVRKKIISLGGSVSFERQGLQALLKALASFDEKGYEIHFLYGAPNHTAPDDLDILNLLNAQEKCHIEPVRCTSAAQFIREIEQSAVMVSGRFHYTIVAYALGTPPIMLTSNTAKNNALAEALDIPEPISWKEKNLERKVPQLIERALGLRDFPVTAAANLKRLQDSARNNMPPLPIVEETILPAALSGN